METAEKHGWQRNKKRFLPATFAKALSEGLTARTRTEEIGDGMNV